MRHPDGRFSEHHFCKDGCILSRISVEMGQFLKKNREKIGSIQRKMVVFDQFCAKNIFERLKFQFSDEIFRNDGSNLCIFFSRDG